MFHHDGAWLLGMKSKTKEEIDTLRKVGKGGSFSDGWEISKGMVGIVR